MLALTALAVTSIAGQGFDPEAWSLLDSKFVVPFAMFHIAGLVFTNEAQLRHFEIFCLTVLAYLTFTAIAFLCGAEFLIFPRFILNGDLGIHADRARGPFLQAVANGVSLNVLALVALHSHFRVKPRKAATAVLLMSVPAAIVATMTRAVWLSFSCALVAVLLLVKQFRSRRISVATAMVVAVGMMAILSSERLRSSTG